MHDTLWWLEMLSLYLTLLILLECEGWGGNVYALCNSHIVLFALWLGLMVEQAKTLLHVGVHCAYEGSFLAIWVWNYIS